MSISTDTTVVTIRHATRDDAQAAGRICYEAFGAISRQHNFPSDMPAPEVGIELLEMLFDHPGFYCIVADADGRTVGSNCLDERGIVAGLGPITVDPTVQNSRIGRLLMTAMLERVRERGFAGVRLLQAAYHNRSLSLYLKLGFDVREPMSVMQGTPARRTIEGRAVRPATTSDLDAANVVCQRVHGHERGRELRDGMEQGTAVVVERDGRITGYASALGFFGHAVAESNADLQALITAAEGFSGPGLIVPTRNGELIRWCLSQGLRVVQPMTLMTIGLYNEPNGAYLPSVLY